MTPLKAAAQIIGFIVGVVLLVWCIRRAVAGGEFSQLKDASPWHVWMLIFCTLMTIVTNGAIFWTIIHPAAPIPMWDVQLVNCVVNLVNYAPVRLGMVTRIAHHRRVDQLPYFTLFAWYGATAIVMTLTFFGVLLATMIRPSADLWWLLVLGVILTTGIGALVYVASHHHLTSRLRGADRMLNRPGHVTAAVILRLVDLVAYGGRLYFALAIIGVHVSFRDWLYLTLLSMVSSLSPLGNIGIREFAISFIGPYLTVPEIEGGAISDQLAAAALVDRAGEAIVFIPLGILSVIWMVHRWRKAARLRPESADPASPEAREPAKTA